MRKRVVYISTSKARSSLMVIRLNEFDEWRLGQEKEPSPSDVVAFIKSMPKSKKQAVLRALINELADSSFEKAKEEAKRLEKAPFRGPTGYDSDKH